MSWTFTRKSDESTSRHRQKQALHVIDILHSSETMYKSVVMGDTNGREGRNASKQKCGRHESTGMSFDADEEWSVSD